MHSTWRPSLSRRSRSPTARAVWPPTPASTSSNTSVVSPPALATLISASITRESSPPEAISRSGPGAVLALQPVVGVQARLDLLEAAGLGLEPLGVAAQVGAQLVGLDPHR